jgi:threonine synthase
LNLGAVNSINWARLMAQVVYFTSALQLGAPMLLIAYSVPCEQFRGRVLRSYVRRGTNGAADYRRLIVATSVNDILHPLTLATELFGQRRRMNDPRSVDIQILLSILNACCLISVRWRGAGGADAPG